MWKNQNGDVSTYRPIRPKRQLRSDRNAAQPTDQSCALVSENVEPERQKPDKLDELEKTFSVFIKTMGESLTKNEERLENTDHKESIQREWQQVAMVVDRLLLIVFVVLTVGVTSGLLLRGTIFQS